MPLCPRAALENAAQKSTINSFIYRKMRQKGQRSGGSGSGLASGCGGCPSSASLLLPFCSLSLCTHANMLNFWPISTRVEAASGGALDTQQFIAMASAMLLSLASISGHAVLQPDEFVVVMPSSLPACVCGCVWMSLLLVSLCAVSSNWPKSLKGSHAARSACPAAVEDCERKGIEEARLLWQGVKWHCIGQCVVCIVSTNERLWYFGEAFAGKGKRKGGKKREQQFRIRFVYCNFDAAVSCGNSCSCTCSITFCCNCELAKFIKFLKGMGAWN